MREEETNLNNEKIIIKLPPILETYAVINRIEKLNSNFLHVINTMLDCVIDLIISNGDIDISKKINNIIEEVKLVTISNGLEVNLDVQEGYDVIKNGIYDIMDEIMVKSDFIHPSEYNYIVETIVNNNIVIVLRKK